ncbi:ABC transporter ATP-binding protein [Halovivax gelatinilyticus]|uniref:ABC transporter ATP-binding protein n=1 Tax=Halovivax gelatinilyticus TaxID=2961597 RepID=UPI003CCE4A23
MTGETEPLLSVRDVTKHFLVKSGLLNRREKRVRAVDGVSFDVEPGETLAVVGESGCGKTTLGKIVSRLLEPTAGEIHFDGTDISSLSNRQLRDVRRNLQVVYQDPTSSLNPRRRVKSVVADPLVVHGIGSKAERRERVVEMMKLVDLPPEFIHRYPTELSGGQKQRVAIARALILNPKLVVLDEPTSALDVSVQAKVISLLEDLQERLDLTYVVISHDLSLVKNIADRIAVMYLGKFMEVGTSEQLFENPLNPYTEQLLSAIPVVESDELAMKPDSVKTTGEPPDPIDPPSGCSFHPRCHKRFGACSAVDPELVEREPGHEVRCLLYPGEKRAQVDAYADEDERRRMRADIGADD